MRQNAMPDCPANWYMLAFSRDLANGDVLTRTLGSQEIVLIRGRKSGAVSAFASHCAHMGCHLKHGTVRGDALQCALHHRVITPSGQFIRRDGSAHEGLSQKSFPVREQYGCIFVRNGGQADGGLPVPEIFALGGVTVAPMREKTLPLPWWTFIANGMDIEHLQAVHDRRLLEPPAFAVLDSHSVRLSYRSMPTGRSIGDRVMTWLASDGVHGRITCIGGTMMLVESKVGKNRAFILLSLTPQGADATTLRGLVGVQSQRGVLAGRLKARISAWLFESFLNKDIGVLDAMQLHAPHSEITQGDSYTRQLFAFLRALPEAESESGQSPSLKLAGRAL